EITAWGEETARDRPEFEPLFAEQDKNALRGCSEGHKFKLQAARHGAISSRMCTNSAPGKVEAGFADAIKRAPKGAKIRAARMERRKWTRFPPDAAGTIKPLGGFREANFDRLQDRVPRAVCGGRDT